MNWDALGAIGELGGSIILIASIFYLSVQIRSSSDHASAASERGVQQDFTQIQDSLIEDDRTMSIIRRGFRSFENLDAQEKFFFHMKISLFINHFEGVLRMSQKGLISDDMVKTFGNIILAFIGTPGGRQFWDQAGTTFQTLSTEYINNNLATGADWGTTEHLVPYFFEGGQNDA